MRVAEGHCVATTIPGTGPEFNAWRLWLFLQEDVRWREPPEGEEEAPETGVVADEVEGVSVEAETLVPRERVRQLTAEQVGNVPRVDVKYSASITGTTVARSVGVGETRPPEFAKDSATTPALTVVATVARSCGDGETRPPEFAKDSATTESNVAV